MLDSWLCLLTVADCALPVTPRSTSKSFSPCQHNSTNTDNFATYDEANILLKSNISREISQNYGREFTEDWQKFRRPNLTGTHSSRDHVTHGRYEWPFLNKNHSKQNNKSHKINIRCANYAYSGPNPLTNWTWKATGLDVTESQNSNILTVVNSDRSNYISLTHTTQIRQTKGSKNTLLIPNVVWGPGSIVGVMYLHYVCNNTVFTLTLKGRSHGSTKGVFAHLGHTATIRAPHTARQGTPGGSGKHDLWQVTVHTVTSAAR